MDSVRNLPATDMDVERKNNAGAVIERAVRAAHALTWYKISNAHFVPLTDIH